jgi:hypothetical protein
MTDTAPIVELKRINKVFPGVKALKDGMNSAGDALDGLKKGIRADYAVTQAKFNALDDELKTAREVDITSERDQVLPFEHAFAGLAPIARRRNEPCRLAHDQQQRRLWLERGVDDTAHLVERLEPFVARLELVEFVVHKHLSGCVVQPDFASVTGLAPSTTARSG